MTPPDTRSNTPSNAEMFKWHDYDIQDKTWYKENINNLGICHSTKSNNMSNYDIIFILANTFKESIVAHIDIVTINTNEIVATDIKDIIAIGIEYIVDSANEIIAENIIHIIACIKVNVPHNIKNIINTKTNKICIIYIRWMLNIIINRAVKTNTK